jgi:hypothetical protein
MAADKKIPKPPARSHLKDLVVYIIEKKIVITVNSTIVK